MVEVSKDEVQIGREPGMKRREQRARVIARAFNSTAFLAVLAGAPALAHAQIAPVPVTVAPQGQPTADTARQAPAPSNVTEQEAGTPTPDDPAAAAQSADGNAEGNIVVTGTRISGFTTPTPVTTVSSEELEDKAVTTVSELLDDVPQLRINQNVGKSSEPVGGSNADLRGLGTQRTLVLIDGRRVAFTDPAGTIDTNIVPTALIGSVEIVTGGASAAYGSDAVAGVVNFVLNKKFTGFKLDASYAQTKYDDHHRPSVSAALGKSLFDDRLHLTVAGDYLHNDGQTRQASRPWGSRQTALLTNPAYTPTNGQPRLIISDNARFTQMTPGGVLVRANGLALAQRLGFAPGTGVQFDRSGNPVPFTYGTNIGGTFMTGGDGATVEDEGNILPEIERYTGFGSARFDVTTDISVFADALYSQVDTFSDLTPNPDNGGLIIRNDNAYLSSSLRTAMAGAGLSSITIGRINFEDGFSQFRSSTKARRFTFGVEGKTGGWAWDVSGQISRNSYSQFSDNNRINARFTLGLDTVVNSATGQPVCRALLANPNPTQAQDPYRDIRDCQPINPFGAGAINERALSYYRGTSYLKSDQDQDVFAANVSGSPVSTWAGDVKLAVGAEYRREKTVQTSDPDSVARRWRSVNAQPFTGKFNVKEAYAELVVPLASGSRFAENLDLNGAIRYTDYSTSGAVTTWKVGVNYSPFTDLRLRGTISRDIRAPNNFELFSLGNQVINAIIDPSTNTSRQVVQITSGNPNLQPEKADTLTAGFVYQPTWFPRFRASVDYYSIKIKQAISTIAPQSIVDFCQAGRTEFCSGVIRDPVTQIITRINVIPFNADSLTTRGVDVELQYRFPVLGGDMRLRTLANYVAELTTTSNGVSNDYVGLAGISPPPQGVPEWRVNIDADYTVNDFKFGIGYRYIDGGKFDTRFNVINFDIADNTVSGRSYIDLSTSYRLNKTFEIYGRVENLFNVYPPITPNGITQPTVANSQFFDRRGTFFVIGGRVRL